jgi:hypothetical protein
LGTFAESLKKNALAPKNRSEKINVSRGQTFSSSEKDALIRALWEARQASERRNAELTVRLAGRTPDLKALVLLGAPWWIRTTDPQLRRLLLYPPELRARRG